MKVILLKAHLGAAGGLEKYASKIFAGFKERTTNVSFLSAPPTVWKEPSWLRIARYDRFVARQLNKHPADIVFGMDRNRFQTHLRAGNGVHAAFLHSRLFSEGRFKHLLCRFNPLHRKILEIEKESFEHPQLMKLFTNSNMVKQEILHYYNVDASKIHTIHNGVEWTEMSHDFEHWEEQKTTYCQKRHLDPHQFHCLFVGHGYLRKGLGQLLKGLALLNRKDVHLSVVGKDRKLPEYLALADRLGIARQVSFFGARKDIYSFYQLADALVIPSWYDPFANVGIEALAMGLFVVSSKHNGGCEILNSTNGVVIDDLLDPSSVAEALKQALSRPKTKESASKIRQSVRAFDFSHQIGSLIDLCMKH